MTSVCFYTSCTMTKSLPAQASLSLGALPQKELDGRFDHWTQRIDGWTGERKAAGELYRGGHSGVLRHLVASNPVGDWRYFVVSAGYGLVSLNDRLAPYAATFAAGHPDSVTRSAGVRTGDENIAWWKRLGGWRPKGISGVRSLTAAAKKWPGSIHLLALSPSYLDAISADLAEARSFLTSHENLIVISTAKKRHGALNGNVLRAPAKLQVGLGGTLVSLNVRLAIDILNSIPKTKLSLDSARKHLQNLHAMAPDREIPQRRRIPDGDVIRFIQKHATEPEASSYSRLLHALRATGLACEMKRFRELFRKTVVS